MARHVVRIAKAQLTEVLHWQLGGHSSSHLLLPYFLSAPQQKLEAKERSPYSREEAEREGQERQVRELTGIGQTCSCMEFSVNSR